MRIIEVADSLFFRGPLTSRGYAHRSPRAWLVRNLQPPVSTAGGLPAPGWVYNSTATCPKVMFCQPQGQHPKDSQARLYWFHGKNSRKPWASPVCSFPCSWVQAQLLMFCSSRNKHWFQRQDGNFCWGTHQRCLGTPEEKQSRTENMPCRKGKPGCMLLWGCSVPHSGGRQWRRGWGKTENSIFGVTSDFLCNSIVVLRHCRR